MRVFFVLCIFLLSGFAMNNDETKAPPPMLTHSVFFELNNNDESSIQSLVKGCYKYLAPHDGIVYFSAGQRHTDYQREVNDLKFDVALTIVFENTDAQDAYQVTEPHKQFIKEFSDNWANVRVFDSLAPAVSK